MKEVFPLNQNSQIQKLGERSSQGKLELLTTIYIFSFKIYLPSVTIYKGNSFQRRLLNH